MATSPASTAAARASSHQATQKATTVAAVVAARNAAKRSLSTQRVGQVVTAYQLLAATQAGQALAAEAGRAPVTIPAAYAGWTALGFPIQDALDTIVAGMLRELDQGAVMDDLLWQLERFVAAEVTDAGRAAGETEIAVQPEWTNYVRLLNPPSCDRCTILAGRIYRDLDGFQRHPLCDCVHWPVDDWETAHDMGLVSSPMEAFNRGQVTGLSKADAAAVAAGADIIAVVNAKRGMRTASLFNRDGVKVTTEGTTRLAAWRKANPGRPYRLRPESIFDIASDYGDLLRLLKLYGYIQTT